ncbi:hypothetical protein GCM10009716_31600 [Streptomyces sodiiphilus]|uniref:Uncharacterized protein n=1 Tax=Streptomyces sodiiphilus TaxID=226217 RepID=A0ABP5ASY5_9ACTN
MSVNTDSPQGRPQALLRALNPFLPVISIALSLGLVIGLVLVGVFQPGRSSAGAAAPGPPPPPPPPAPTPLTRRPPAPGRP